MWEALASGSCKKKTPGLQAEHPGCEALALQLTKRVTPTYMATFNLYSYNRFTAVKYNCFLLLRTISFGFLRGGYFLLEESVCYSCTRQLFGVAASGVLYQMEGEADKADSFGNKPLILHQACLKPAVCFSHSQHMFIHRKSALKCTGQCMQELESAGDCFSFKHQIHKSVLVIVLQQGSNHTLGISLTKQLAFQQKSICF